MAPTVVLVTILLLILSLEAGTALPATSPSEFIIGGNTTDIRHHRFQVAIWSGSEFRGSGALVDSGWAITTASIVVGFDANTLSVRAHSSLASSGRKLCDVGRVLIHPSFRFSNMTFDVALLKLNCPMMSTLMSWEWIPLAHEPLPANSTPMLSGWGSSTKSTKMSDQLLQSSMRPVALSECQEAYTLQILPTQFCAIADDVYGPCWGDNGDLLVYRGRLYGLLSWNKGCYDDVVPSVFTDIHLVYNWVLKVVRKSNRRKPRFN